MSLPELVAFSIKDREQEVRYLSFTGPHRQLRFGIEEGVYSDTVSFTVEEAGSGLVHLRSCYENKYWVKASGNEPWLVATALEKVEDISKAECTVFRTQFSPGNVFVNFVHAQSGFNVVVRPAHDAHAYNLCVEHGPPTDFNFIRYSDFASVKLPRYIMFLDDYNRFLVTDRHPTFIRLAFGSRSLRDETAGFEIEYAKSGDVRVKSMWLGGLWGAGQRSGEWRTLLLLDPKPDDPNTLFEVSRSTPAFAQYEGVSLRCRGVNLVCVKMPGIDDLGLLANVQPNDLVACLRPWPPTKDGFRKVNIESFRHPWAYRSSEVYNWLIITNQTAVEEKHLFVEPNIPMSTRTTFRNTISNFQGPDSLFPLVDLFSGQFPFVATSGELEFPDKPTSILSKWGHEHHTSVNQRYEETIILPPQTRCTIIVHRKNIVYEIPFSYQQMDEFHWGGNVTQYLHEGTFRINQDYNIEHTIESTSVRSEEDVSPLGVESSPGSGIFVYQVPNEQDKVETDAPDQGSDAQADIGPDGLNQDAERVVGIKTDASD
ncbi:hypothetical protein RND81_14G219800 [Saponaria officinalis]|uniref:Agglutinin domain-containing protein n=1 Tax=Saponaria officinalis TaxID=3572 RepID=A0AAW1GQV4_SAPOF